jgi:hypothetical protein
MTISGDEMEAALGALGAKLKAEGIRAKLSLVGGAVMVLSYHSRTATGDIDAVAKPAEAVFAAARDVGIERGLPPEWLNDHAKVYLPIAVEPTWRPIRTYGNLEVFAADPRMMLAMKLRALRGRRDQDDIRVLLEATGATSPADAVAIYEEFFPGDPLSVGARRFLAQELHSSTDDEVDAEEVSLLGRYWATSSRGKLSHRLVSQDDEGVLTVCGEHLKPENVVLTRRPTGTACPRCTRPHRS